MIGARAQSPTQPYASLPAELRPVGDIRAAGDWWEFETLLHWSPTSRLHRSNGLAQSVSSGERSVYEHKPVSRSRSSTAELGTPQVARPPARVA